MAATLDSVADIERALAAERVEETDGHAFLRTSVMTHVAWVPPEWVGHAENVLQGLAERHPSRTIVLLPEPDAPDGLDGDVSVERFPVGENTCVCTETIRVRLRGPRTRAPASVVEPLVMPDLPVFLRWRGRPEWDSTPFRQLVETADRLIVDSTEWPDLPSAYGSLAEIFEEIVVSDIAWARTSRWRAQLASLWPGIGDVRSICVHGTPAQAYLLTGWLSSRLGRRIELECRERNRLEGIELDGEPAPFPPGDPPDPADLLSDELDRFTRDRIYEEASRAAAELASGGATA